MGHSLSQPSPKKQKQNDQNHDLAKISNLPSEVLETIFEKLDVISILNLGCVGKIFSIICCHRFLWKKKSKSFRSIEISDSVPIKTLKQLCLKEEIIQSLSGTYRGEVSNPSNKNCFLHVMKRTKYLEIRPAEKDEIDLELGMGKFVVVRLDQSPLESMEQHIKGSFRVTDIRLNRESTFKKSLGKLSTLRNQKFKKPNRIKLELNYEHEQEPPYYNPQWSKEFLCSLKSDEKRKASIHGIDLTFHSHPLTLDQCFPARQYWTLPDPDNEST
eukprot:TRINITY_DN9813_c0_g1_i1.p1 TRINITY_DN9813_c0_g1~~TRINITY_DN9813_c0_g1_i1.p1  ORF type:complete len:272 (-),score=52.47 TRINITY_DN9813_c0_g1_i1:121-936(-)